MNKKKKLENKAEREINKKITKVLPFARFCFVFVPSGFYLEIAFMRPDNGSYVSGIGNQDLKKIPDTLVGNIFLCRCQERGKICVCFR